ncbi:MAG: branched-chain amino acid ABC transporter permease [Solirubrobacteraceae bacterium]
MSLPRRVPGWALALLGLGAFALFPQVDGNVTATSIAVFALIYMVATSAWNIFSGYSGYLALGHAVFFGTGAYALALAEQGWQVPAGWTVFALLPFAGLVAGLVAIPVGMIALRTRRHTFVVVTIAIFFVFQLFATNVAFTGGTAGYQLNQPVWSAYTFNDPFIYMAVLVLAGTVALSWAVRRSRFGLQLLSIRDDEERARGLGVRVGRVKLAAFVLSAIPVGMVGGLYAFFLGSIYPQSVFDPLFDISIALMGFLGGLGTIAGPLLGGLVLESLQQYFTQHSGDYLIIYGVLFLVVILVLPRGVIPSLQQLWRWYRTRSERTTVSQDPSSDVAGALR